MTKRPLGNRNTGDDGTFLDPNLPFDDAVGSGTVADVTINGTSVGSLSIVNNPPGPTNDPASRNTLAFTAPAGLSVDVTTGHDIVVVPDPGVGGASSTMNTPLLVRDELAFVAVGGADYLHSFDGGSGEPVDLDTSDQDGAEFLNSVLDFAASPAGVTFSGEENHENQELFVVAGDSFYRAEKQNGTFVLSDVDGNSTNGLGVFIGSDARELILDPNGHFGFVLHGTGEISAVQVEKLPDEMNRFAVSPVLGTVLGTASRLRVASLQAAAGPRFAVWATSSCIDCGPNNDTCSPPIALAAPQEENEASPRSVGLPGILTTSAGLIESVVRLTSLSLAQQCESDCEFLPDPGSGGGGSGPSPSGFRQVWLNAFIVEAVLDPSTGVITGWNVSGSGVCEKNILISSFEAGETAPLWDNVGLDFDGGGATLFVVSPETDELVAFDTQGVNESAPPGWLDSRIPVGVNPFDVVVNPVRGPAGLIVQRAYVANHGDSSIPSSDSMTIVNLANGQTTNVDLNLEDANHLGSTHISASEIIDGLGRRANKIFLTASERDKLLFYSVLINGDAPQSPGSIPVGPTPLSMAFQEPALPTP